MIPPARVRVLPDALIDQIAAGEVVERPASVVKELVENALDAGATRVRVEVREGGAALVAVTDDGCGMTPDDARLALLRHATSKLGTADDLSRIRSYGFRGEALPAIASVSRLRLLTRPRGAEEGFELRVESGETVRAAAAGGPEGTRIEVADLFGSVPARRKFLKSPVTEWGHVADWLARVALACPAIHFDVRRDDRAVLTWPAAADPLDRIAAVLSDDEASALVPVRGEAGAARLSGFVSQPGWHRATGDGIHLFVNGRPVRDRLLRHAVVEVYRDLLPRGRFPAAVLFLDLPTGAVDVNVHPAKWEVRFADPRGIHELVRRSLRDAIGRRDWIAGAGADAGRSTRSGVGSAGAERLAPDAVGTGSTPQATDWIFAVPPGTAAPGTAAPGAAAEPGRGAGLAGLAQGAGEASASAGMRFADLRAVGQLNATYLVLEAKDGLVLVDQHAAHERVLYERLRASRLEGGVPRQGLLAPAVVELEAASASALLAAGASLETLGFELEGFGAGAVAVRAIPALLSGQDPAPLVRTLAEELRAADLAGAGAEAGLRLLPVLDRVFATLACHAARRKGDVMSPREQQALLEALDTIPWAPTCPHGRPVAVSLDRSELERRFARR